MRTRWHGFTLIELLMAMTVLAILGGVNASVLNTGFDAWNYCQGRLAIQQVANELVEQLLEGGFEGEGLKDAVELREAGLTAISVVPLWTDRSHTPDLLHNKAQKFVLEKQFKSGAPTPIAQIRERDKEEWVSVPVRFDEGAGKDPKQVDDVVTFLNPIPQGAELKVLYTPDATANPETQMRFWWNPEDGQVYRTYAGASAPLIPRMHGVRINQMAFLYYDNLIRMLPLGQTYTTAELRRITGIKLYLLLQRNDQWQEITSFTNVRNVESVGATISRGSILPLPDPQTIKAWSVGDFAGLKGKGVVEFVVKTAQRARWKIHLEFQPGPRDDVVLLTRFQIESPVGTVLTSGLPNQTIAKNEFVNLLSLDRSGLYNYTNAKLGKNTNPYMEVTQCDFETASVFIRP